MENKLKQEEGGVIVEIMGQSNQVHQLKLLQKITILKISEFCENISKSKNANRVKLIIYI